MSVCLLSSKFTDFGEGHIGVFSESPEIAQTQNIERAETGCGKTDEILCLFSIAMANCKPHHPWLTGSTNNNTEIHFAKPCVIFFLPLLQKREKIYISVKNSFCISLL